MTERSSLTVLLFLQREISSRGKAAFGSALGLPLGRLHHRVISEKGIHCLSGGLSNARSGRLAHTRERTIQLLEGVMGFAVKLFLCVLLAGGCSDASSSQALCCKSECVLLHSFPQTAYRRFRHDPGFLRRKGRNEQRRWAKLCRQQEEHPPQHSQHSS